MGVAVSQEEAPAVVRLEVPADKVDFVYKAIEDHLGGGTRESQDFFAQQNPATRKLSEIVAETYDAMVHAMADEIKEVLHAPSKESR